MSCSRTQRSDAEARILAPRSLVKHSTTEPLRSLIYIYIYQSPLILTELFQHNLINVSYLTACYLYQVMMTLHFLNDVANDAESIKKNKKICHNR